MAINKKWFLEKINDFLAEDDSNRMKIDGSLIFDLDVLVGFCEGSDTIFEEYKEIIGDFHLTPTEAYTKYCEKKNISHSTENLSVVAFILPPNQKTKKENLEHSKEMPGERWAHT